MSFDPFRNRIEEALVGCLGAGTPDAVTVASVLVPAQKAAQGDYAFPAFALAKVLRKPPPAIAAELAAAVQQRLAPDAGVAKVVAMGPYCNFFIDATARAKATLEAVLCQGDRYGHSTGGEGRSVCVDFSSPNIAKPFGIGHLRSTVIGSAICNLYRATGWTPVGINHLGDWGKQFGMLMVALSDRGGESELDGAEDAMAALYRMYVEIHRLAEEDPEIEVAAKAWFRSLEQGDEEARRLWARCKEVSLAAFGGVYARLGIDNFTHWWGESHYEGEPMDRVIRALGEAGVLEESDGAQVVFLDEPLPPCLIVKADGATLYATRDLAGAIYRQEQANAARIVYVVGHAQETHFKQVFQTLGKLGEPWTTQCRCVHVPFGLIRGMSTRKGTMVLLADVLDEAVARVREIVADRDYPESEKAKISEQVGVGAVIFADLTNLRMRDWEFDWDQLLNFNGRTGPYLQYSYVRLGSVLEKFRTSFGEVPDPADVDLSLLSEPETVELLRRLAELPAVVERACEEHEPSLVSRYLLDLAEANNRFYNQCKVVDTKNAPLSSARILPVAAVRQALANGLSLLGVPLPERM